MSDYLSDLVTRNIGTADVTQPRRPARFEPARATGALEAVIEPSSFQADIFEEKQIIEPTTPARRRGVRLTEKNEKISSLMNADEEIEQALLITPPEIRSPETERNDARVILAPRIIEEKQETTGESFPVPSLSSQTFSPSKAPPKSAQNQEVSNDIIEQALIQTHRAPAAETDGLEISPAKSFDRQSIEMLAPIIIEPRVEKAENHAEDAAIHQTIIQLAQEQMSKQISERAAIPETPVINVTIGRVEIRAAVSFAPPKQSHAKPQTLSLDEYLRKRRNGGER